VDRRRKCNEVKGVALNPKQAPRTMNFGEVPILSIRAQAKRREAQRQVSRRAPGVSDGIELHRGSGSNQAGVELPGQKTG
jgi:hypothetical protein